VSHAGYIKRTAADTYRHQSRGGKGRIGAKTKEEDFVEHLFIASAHSYICCSRRRARLLAESVRVAGKLRRHARQGDFSLVKFQEDENLRRSSRRVTWKKRTNSSSMATKSGTVKKSALTEFSNPRSTGIIAITLDGKDELIGAKLTDGKKMIFLAATTARQSSSAKRKCGRWA